MSNYDAKSYEVASQFLEDVDHLYGEHRVHELASLIHKTATDYIAKEHDNYDPTPYCSGCGAMRKSQCDCGPIAENE